MIGIYKIENKVNGKVYIGQSSIIETRWKNHIRELDNNEHRNTYLQNAWIKYGKSNFEFEVIEECSIEDLDEREIYWIDRFNSFYKYNGYNLSLGGGGTRIVTDEMAKKMYELYNTGKYIPLDVSEELEISLKTVRRYLYNGTEKGLREEKSWHS